MGNSVRRLMKHLGVKSGVGGQLQRQLWWRNIVVALSYVRQVCSELSVIIRELSRIARA